MAGRKIVIPTTGFTGPVLVESDSTAPTVPGSFAVSVSGPRQAVATWAAASDATGVAGYRIYRDNVLVTTVTALTYTDIAMSIGVSHAYQVSAIDAAGNESARTAAVNVTPRDYNDTDLLSSGSLILVEPGNPTTPWAAGIPASGTTVTNLANTQAAALIGAAAPLTFANNIGAGAVVERSTKGGLHISPSRTVDVASTVASINLGTALKAYLESHLTDDLYISFWGKYTRVPDASVSDVTFAAALRASNDGTKWAGLGMYAPSAALSAQPPSGARRLGVRTLADAQGVFESVGATDSGTVTTLDPRLLAHGPIGSAWLHKTPSILTWRVYVENLTASGRTYAAVDAIDYALYQAATATGGRYNGDTYTAPSSVA